MKRPNLILLAFAATTTLGLLAADNDNPEKTPDKVADKAWLTDFEEARKIAAKEDKSILIDFTGSDWCGWCIKLKKEVFSHDEFVKEASKDFVLVELDFPKKNNQSEEEKAANKALVKKYNVQGFPTIILADAEGKKFGQTGYREGGPAPYLKHLKKLLDRKDLE
jgi:thioredoxin-related protein